MSEFTDLSSGGRALVPLLEYLKGQLGVVVLAVMPNGVPGAIEISHHLDVPVLSVEIDRTHDGEVRLPALDGFAHVIVVDDAVESGTAARAVGQALRHVTHAQLTLAVPVGVSAACESLSAQFDNVVVAVSTPQQQPLTAHYSHLRLLTRDEGLALLAELQAD